MVRPIRRVPVAAVTTAPAGSAPVPARWKVVEELRVRDSAVARIREWQVRNGTACADISKTPAEYPRFDMLLVDDRTRLWAFRRTTTGQAIDVWSRNSAQIAMVDSPLGPATCIGRDRAFAAARVNTKPAPSPGSEATARDAGSGAGLRRRR